VGLTDSHFSLTISVMQFAHLSPGVAFVVVDTDSEWLTVW